MVSLTKGSASNDRGILEQAEPMAKNRNTTEKRYRENEKKRRADDKRARRASKKLKSNDVGPIAPEATLSSAEHSVLAVFRKFLMDPGQMLCIGELAMHEFKVPLARLVDRGLLTPDRFRGGYSLTDAGFVALRNCG